MKMDALLAGQWLSAKVLPYCAPPPDAYAGQPNPAQVSWIGTDGVPNSS